MLDSATHLEFLEFIRATISEADQEFASQIAKILEEVCDFGQADRATIWVELTPAEQQQFQTLLAPPPIARDFAKRIKDTIGYRSPAVAAAVQAGLETAINAGKVALAEFVAIIGEAQFGEFKRLVASCPRFASKSN